MQNDELDPEKIMEDYVRNRGDILRNGISWCATFLSPSSGCTNLRLYPEAREQDDAGPGALLRLSRADRALPAEHQGRAAFAANHVAASTGPASPTR